MIKTVHCFQLVLEIPVISSKSETYAQKSFLESIILDFQAKFLEDYCFLGTSIQKDRHITLEWKQKKRTYVLNRE